MPDITHHKLRERVKELTALHRTARILQDDARSGREIVREIVGLLPAAWQYPEITAARIRFQDVDETSAGFRETDWMQTAHFTTRTHGAGTIEVAYLEKRPPETEGPFLAEERDLINSLAEMLRSYFQHKLAHDEVQLAYTNLERLVSERTAELQRMNADLEREIAGHQQARKKIEEYQDRLRRLATELTLAEARERREIAVDLHDHIIQEFAFIKLRILQFRGDAVFCGFERNLDEIISLLEGAIRYTRQLTFEISTPILYELGLTSALEWLAEQYEKRHSVPIILKLHKHPEPMPEAIRVTLFKCVQELLTNAVKYANAGQITIKMKNHSGSLLIEVADDGVGFDTGRLETDPVINRGFGLFSIRERLKYLGGEMSLKSSLGEGTSVTLSVRLES